MDADLARPWTIERLAARAGTSGEHLRRLCRQHAGHSPMRHAAVLAFDSFTVESVACKVGYDNPFAFSTAFKRSLGLSPSEYRDRANMR